MCCSSVPWSYGLSCACFVSLFCFVCLNFYLFWARPQTWRRWPSSTRLVILTRFLQMTATDVLVTTSSAPTTAVSRRIVSPFSLLYQTSYIDRRSRTLWRSSILGNRLFAGCSCLSSRIFAQEKKNQGFISQETSSKSASNKIWKCYCVPSYF